MREMTMNELQDVNGGSKKTTAAAFVGGAIVGGIIYDVAKSGAKEAVNGLSNQSYDKTVTRQGKKYRVKYKGSKIWN